MQFLPGSCRIDNAVWMHYMDANKTAGEEASRQLHKSARGVMVIVVGNGHGDTSSNPGQDWLHFT